MKNTDDAFECIDCYAQRHGLKQVNVMADCDFVRLDCCSLCSVTSSNSVVNFSKRYHIPVAMNGAAIFVLNACPKHDNPEALLDAKAYEGTYVNEHGDRGFPSFG